MENKKLTADEIEDFVDRKLMEIFDFLELQEVILDDGDRDLIQEYREFVTEKGKLEGYPNHDRYLMKRCRGFGREIRKKIFTLNFPGQAELDKIVLRKHVEKIRGLN